MRDDWAKTMKARLARARIDPPTAESMRPVVDKIARDAARRSAATGRAAQVRVQASRTAVRVDAAGPGARQVMDDVRAGVRRQRAEMREAVKADAQAKLKGTGK